MQAVGCWELPVLHAAWRAGGLAAVEEEMVRGAGWQGAASEQAVHGAAESRSTRPVMTRPPVPGTTVGGGAGHSGVGGAVHVYATGFSQSPYADVKPAGSGGAGRPPTHHPAVPRKLWHASPGSSGR